MDQNGRTQPADIRSLFHEIPYATEQRILCADLPPGREIKVALQGLRKAILKRFVTDSVVNTIVQSLKLCAFRRRSGSKDSPCNFETLSRLGRTFDDAVDRLIARTFDVKRQFLASLETARAGSPAHGFHRPVKTWNLPL
jgi:hypothetical protein